MDQQKNRKIIGLIGFKGSGKDTVANYLQTEHDFQQCSFAATLKDAIAAIFSWDRNLLEGRTEESRIWREQVDIWWSKRLNLPNLTPRYILSYWGTELCRGCFHDDIWIASLEHRLNAIEKNIVISDVRFTNEIKSITKLGGKVIRVKRGQEPNWFDTALILNLSHHNDILKERLEDQLSNIHPSERNWIGWPFDYVIENNSSIEDLKTATLDILKLI